jgi:hypothetical protein
MPDPRAVIATIADELDGPEDERLTWAAGIYAAIGEAGYEVVDRLEVAAGAAPPPRTP